MFSEKKSVMYSFMYLRMPAYINALLKAEKHLWGLSINYKEYLKVSRLIKRRTVANEACDAGKITVNDKVARASYDVKVGDVIEITLGSKSVKVKVTEVKEVVRKEDAATMYEAAVWFFTKIKTQNITLDEIRWVIMRKKVEKNRFKYLHI